MNGLSERLPSVLLPGHVKNGLIYEGVAPATDQWLLSPERTWEEVDSVIEGRLQGIQANFDGRSSHLAELYGVEKAASGNMSRFLAYVELLDQNRQPHDFFLSQATASGKAWEDERGEVRRKKQAKTIGAGKADNEFKKLEAKYNALTVKDTQRSVEISEIEDLILRKAVLDIFSVANNTSESGRPLIIQDFPKLVDTAKQNFSNNPHKDSKYFGDGEPIDYFLESFSNYLYKTKDDLLFNRYEYRKSPGLVAKKDDCQVLDSALIFTLDSKRLDVTDSTNTRLTKVGDAYFSFLSRRATSLSSRDIFGESYPLLSSLYDVFTVGLNRGKISVLQNLSKLVDKHYGNFVYSHAINSEFAKFKTNWISLATPAFGEFSKDLDVLKTMDPLEYQFAGRLPQSVIDFYASVEERILNLCGLNESIENDDIGEFVSPSYVLSILNKGLLASVDGLSIIRNLKGYTVPDQIFLFDCMNQFARTPMYQQAGIEVDLRDAVDSANKERYSSMIAGEHDEFLTNIEAIKEAQKELNINEDSGISTLIGLFGRKWREQAHDLEQVEKENDFLWVEILDNSEWFVSPRGDRFSANNDLQLKDFYIDSVTLGIDREHPRDHFFSVRLSGFDNPVGFWLDINKNLLDRDRRSLFLDPKAKAMITNLLLKRLYFITSGLLSGAQVPHEGEYEEGPVYQYKRACYVHLFSTEANPITMESNSAKQHAVDIERDYGIKIYEEIKRRRALGTIAPNEFLTFRKESEPLTSSGAVRPNDLRFNPELIQIPV